VANIVLREYQLTAIAELRTALAAPASSAVLVLPTGAGKTTVAAELTRLMVARGGTVWFVAHLQELVSQARARMEAFGLSVGEIGPQKEVARRLERPVQCCMVQSLSVALRTGQIPAHRLPTFIFFDEGHHTAAGTYQRVIDAAPLARRIGLTATPYRLDGKALGEWYQAMVEPITIGELMDAGHLVRAHYALAEVDLEGLGERGGDYAADQAFKKFNKRQLYAGTVTQYENHAPGEKAICFCINVEHSLATVQAFNERGIAAAHLDGSTPLAQRKRVLEEFAAGRWQVLSNVALFTEGFDLPNISCVILNRPTKSKALYLQMGGRGLRPSPGKSRCLIIDMGGNVKAHSFLDTPAEHSLEPAKKKKGATVGVRPMKMCKSCGLWDPISFTACGACGAAYPIEVAKQEEVTFTVVTDTRQFLPPAVKKRQRFKALPPELEGVSPWQWTAEQWAQVRVLSGYKRGWESHQLEWQKMHGPEAEGRVAA
jgi:superfamily II DNA or RNA helicase